MKGYADLILADVNVIDVISRKIYPGSVAIRGANILEAGKISHLVGPKTLFGGGSWLTAIATSVLLVLIMVVMLKIDWEKVFKIRGKRKRSQKMRDMTHCFVVVYPFYFFGPLSRSQQMHRKRQDQTI